MSQFAAPGFVPEITMGVRLRLSRETTGLDRSAFAERIGIHRDSLAKYETDRAVPRPPVLGAWALATGVDLGWIRTGVPTDPSPTPGGGRSFLLVDAPETPRSSVSVRIRALPAPVSGAFAA